MRHRGSAAAKRHSNERRPMNLRTKGQFAEEIMLSRRPCVLVLCDGRRISCDRISKTSPMIVGTHRGDIEAIVGGSPQTFFLDDIEKFQ
jgi:hypothetical protein